MLIEEIIDILHAYFNIGSDSEAMIEYMNCAEEILTAINSKSKVIEVEGYKMFSGSMIITPKAENIKPFEVVGNWLYKPEYKCWYCNGSSYMEEICKIKDAIVL